MIGALEEGLNNIQKAAAEGWGGQRLGDGEIRRRKDLIIAAKKDKDGLENLLSAMTQKSKLDSAIASVQDKDTLLATKHADSTSSSKPGRGRGTTATKTENGRARS